MTITAIISKIGFFGFRELKIETPQDEFRDSNGLIPEGLTKQRTSMIHYAYEFMGIPHKWNGTDENGFDCSGYTRHVFLYKGIESQGCRRINIIMPRK